MSYFIIILTPAQCVIKISKTSSGISLTSSGSFGTYPKIIRDKMRGFQDTCEARPDSFIRYEYPPLLDEARASMGKVHLPSSSNLDLHGT
jgi:hypothetical protein